MWRGAVIGTIGMLWVASVQAAPWPREKGEVFTAVTGSYRYAPETGQVQREASFFLEYGLTPRVTAGFDANDAQADYTHAYAFVRWPVSPAATPLKRAVSVGAGLSRSDGDWGPMARLAFELGQEIDGKYPGWWSIVAALEDHSVSGALSYKLDATLGIDITPGIKGIVDVETSRRSGLDHAVTVRTSLGWKLRGPHHVILGFETKDANTRSYGVRVGLWRRF